MANAIVQDSFNDFWEGSDSQDNLMTPFQDSSEELFSLNGSSDVANWLIDDDNNSLFDDAYLATDSFSSEGDLGSDYFDYAETSTSCPSQEDDGQPLSKLRARQEVCKPNGQPSDSISDFINNPLGIFKKYDGKEEETQAIEENSAQVCSLYYPRHLCCG